MRTTLRLRDELIEGARKKAAKEGRTLTSIVEEGLIVVLSREPEVARDRVRLPVSRAKGGVLPGIDLNDSSSLEDAMNR